MAILFAISITVATTEVSARERANVALGAWLQPQFKAALTFGDHPWFQEGVAESTLSYEVERDGQQGYRAIVWRYVTAVQVGRQWWQHSVILEDEAEQTVLHYALQCTGAGGEAVLLPWQTHPMLLNLATRGGYFSQGIKWDSSVNYVTDESALQVAVLQGLMDQERKYPLALYCPDPNNASAVVPERLAVELLGIAPVVALSDPGLLSSLTGSLGDQSMGCPLGGLRLYLASEEEEIDSLEHPMISARSLQREVKRLEFTSALARGITRDGAVVGRIDNLVARLQQDRQRGYIQVTEAKKRALESEGDYRSLLALAETESAHYKQEVDKLRADLGRERQKALALEEQLQAGRGPASDIGMAELLRAASIDSVLDAVEVANDLMSASLHFLPSAWKSAANSPYADTGEALRALVALSEVAGCLLRQAAGTSLEELFAARGQDYVARISETSSARIKAQHEFRDSDGTEYSCVEHLRLGSSYDPKHCLRIYFTTRPTNNGRVVIGHVGRHLETSVQRS